MRVALALALALAASAAAAVLGCARTPPVQQGYGLLTFVCDTTPRPARPAEIPAVSSFAGYGALTGVAFRESSGNGIDSGTVILTPLDISATHIDRRRLTGLTGGFAFDSVPAGRYRLRVFTGWERTESAFVAVAIDRVDTIRIPFRSPGSCGRS